MKGLNQPLLALKVERSTPKERRQPLEGVKGKNEFSPRVSRSNADLLTP